MDLSWIMYDTAIFGTSAAVTSALFQTAEGGDATHTTDFTNCRGAGSFPTGEKYLIRKLGVTFESNHVEADVEDWFVAAYLRLMIANQIMFQSPLIPLMWADAYSGQYTQAAAAVRAFIGRLGNGYELDPQLLVKGGDAFKVEIYQGTALATASMKIKFMMDGILTRP